MLRAQPRWSPSGWPRGDIFQRGAMHTEEIRRQASLLKTGALQNAILNSANFSSIATDEEGVIQIFNIGAEHMLGYAAADVLNKITPADISDPQEVVARAKRLSLELRTTILPGFEALVFKASRGIEDIYELTYIRKDGSRLPAVVSVTALRDEQEGIIGYLLIGTDNTARKLVEEEVKRLHAELEERVILRTAELESANTELEAFSYSVSHDLRAPLRAMDGFSQAVLEDFGGLLPAEGRRQLQTIREGAQRMGALIDALLKFARLGRKVLNKQAINTDQLVRGALEELGFPWPDRKVEVLVGKLLKQVWLNLLSNALKYTRKRERAVLEIGCEKTGGVDTFFVRDNGTGFDMRYVDKLFGVFQRFHRAEDFEGTGVGLAIVQRIVQRHGGRAWAEAADVSLHAGKGTYTMNETIAAELLLVEDSPQDLELALRALRKANLAGRVHVARDGAEALDYIFCEGAQAGRGIKAGPKVILLDLKLPKVDGLDVLKRLKGDERTKSIPVVVLTSSKEQSDIVESYNLGVNSYIVKPVDFEQFTEAVRTLGLYWLLLNQPPKVDA
jgi:PAS domain S-box-containing protein